MEDKTIEQVNKEIKDKVYTAKDFETKEGKELSPELKAIIANEVNSIAFDTILKLIKGSFSFTGAGAIKIVGTVRTITIDRNGIIATLNSTGATQFKVDANGDECFIIS